MNMAYLEAVTALAYLLPKFDFKLAARQSDITYGNALTLPMKNGLRVQVTKRQ